MNTEDVAIVKLSDCVVLSGAAPECGQGADQLPLGFLRMARLCDAHTSASLCSVSMSIVGY